MKPGRVGPSITEQKKNHGEALKQFFGLPETVDAVELVSALQKIERRAHKVAEMYCNGEVREAGRDRNEERFLKQLGVLGLDTSMVFINGDPRGYALKIRGDFSIGFKGVTDWGSYGILGPDFN